MTLAAIFADIQEEANPQAVQDFMDDAGADLSALLYVADSLCAIDGGEGWASGDSWDDDFAGFDFTPFGLNPGTNPWQ